MANFSKRNLSWPICSRQIDLQTNPFGRRLFTPFSFNQKDKLCSAHSKEKTSDFWSAHFRIYQLLSSSESTSWMKSNRQRASWLQYELMGFQPLTVVVHRVVVVFTMAHHLIFGSERTWTCKRCCLLFCKSQNFLAYTRFVSKLRPERLKHAK